MAWEPGTRRETIPLPPEATNDDLQLEFVYDTGARKVGDWTDVMLGLVHRGVELKQVRFLNRPDISCEDISGYGFDWWTRASDDLIVGQTWVGVEYD